MINLTLSRSSLQALSLKPLRTLGAVLVAAMLLIAPLTGHAQTTIKAGVQYSADSYRIGPGDVLSVQVYNQPDLAQENILVRDDGMATFNTVGDVFITGKTLSEATQDVRLKLSDLVIDPIVTISISQAKPSTVYLAGAVNHPGMYQITSNTSKGQGGSSTIARTDFRLSNILSNSGGVALNADLSQVEIRRERTGEVTVVNLWQMIKEGDQSVDMYLQSGDAIYVPQLAKGIAMSDDDYNTLLKSPIGPGSFPVRVIGGVTTPGIYDLTGNSPLLNSAIAKAGGYKQSGNTKSVAIRRFDSTGENPTTMILNPEKDDIVLHPNDIVYVPEKAAYKTAQLMETVAKVFAPFHSVSSLMLPFIWASK